MMQRCVSPSRAVAAPLEVPHEEFGGKLQRFFDGVTSGPMPDRLIQLAAQLEAAVERGELECSRPGVRGR